MRTDADLAIVKRMRKQTFLHVAAFQVVINQCYSPAA
jgi:hypothetical protein